MASFDSEATVMAGAEASVATASGTPQHAPTQADADADAHSPRALRALCLAAAAGIRDECHASLLAGDGGVAHTAAAAAAAAAAADGAGCSSSAGTAVVVGGAHGDKHADSRPVARTSRNNSLAGCGAPLVQLLARQATCVAARYERLSGRHAEGAPRADAVLAAGRDRGRAPCDDGDSDGGEPKAAECGVSGLRHDRLVLKRLDDILSIAYTRFYAYLYKDLPLCWRQLYTDAAILKFSFLLLPLSQDDMHRCAQQREDRSDGINVDVQHAAALPPSDASTTLDEMVKTLDLALILAGGGGKTRGRAWIDEAFELLEAGLRPFDNAKPSAAVNDMRTRPTKRAKLDNTNDSKPAWSAQPSFSAQEPFTPPTKHPIPRVPASELPMPAFQHYLDTAPRALGPQPLVITGLADAWPARAKRAWCKPAYLLSRTLGGRRLVPVEVGRSYVDAGWGQRIMRFGEFLEDFVDRSPPLSGLLLEEEAAAAAATAEERPPTGYLAQHQLLLQLPQLRNDVLLPDLCYTSPPLHPTDPAQDQHELDEPMLNAWFGPPGTITPLHTDPYHNLLVQVVGRKYVRLYAPQESRGMCARGKEDGVEMGNTSSLDVGVMEGWDTPPEEEDRVEDGEGGEGREQQEAEGERRRFRTIPFVDCILEPGDTLYIPIGWWHYVRGLRVSFSVSIWWN